MFFFVIRHHRKRKEKEQRGTKKQRTATKNKRKVRLPENDVGHNVENHLNQSESEEEVEEQDDEMGESNAAGAALAGTATAATATRKGPAPAAEGEGAPLRPPIAKKRKICCSVCRKTGHQKPKCPDLEYADAETPKPTLNVVEGQVIRCWDIESELLFLRLSSIIFQWACGPQFKRMARSTFEITEVLCCEFRYRHRHFQVLEGPKITSMIVLRDINRPLSGCLYNYRVHTGIKSLS